MQRLTGTLLGSLTLEGVELRDRFGNEAIAAERLELRYDLSDLWHRRLRVQRLRIARPRVVVRRTASGTLSLAELLAPRRPEPDDPASEPMDIELRLDALEVDDGVVVIEGSAKRAQKANQKKEYVLRISGISIRAALGLQRGDLRLELRELAGRAALPDGAVVQASQGGFARLQGERLHGRLTLAASGLVPRREARLVLTASGSLHKPRARLELELPGQGKAMISAEAELLGERFVLGAYRLRAGLQGIDPGALWPGLPDGRLGLVAHVSGQGIPLEAASTLRAEVNSDGAEARGYRLDGLDLKAALRGPAWTVEGLVARAYGATLSAEAKGDRSSVQSSRVKLHAPELERLPWPAGLSRPGGSLSVEVQGSGPFEGPYDLGLVLDGKHLALKHLGLGQLGVKAELSGLPRRPSGTARVELSALDPGIPRLRLRRAVLGLRGRRERLEVDLDARGPELAARLGAILSLDEADLRAELRRLSLDFMGRRLDLSQQTRLRWAARERLDIGPMRVRLLGGELGLEGVVNPRGFPRVSARVVLDGVQPLEGRPGLSATLEAEAGSKTLSARLKVTSAPTLTLDAALPLRYRAGSPWPGLALQGPVSATLEIPRLDLSELGHYLPKGPALRGRAALTLLVSGSLRDPSAEVHLALDDIGALDLKALAGVLHLSLHPTQSQISGRLTLGGRALCDLDVTAGIGVGRWLRSKRPLWSQLASVPVTGTLTLGPTPLSTVSALDPSLRGRFGGELRGSVIIKGTALQPRGWLLIEGLGLRVDRLVLGDLSTQAELWGEPDHLAGTLTFEAQGRSLLAAEAEVGVPLGHLLGGLLPGTAPFKAEVQLASRPIAGLLPGHALLSRALGTLSGQVSASGTLGAPLGQVRLDVRQVGFDRRRFGDLVLRSTLGAGQRLEADLTLRQGRRGQLRTRLALDLRRPDTLSATATARDLDLAVLSGLVPGPRSLAGRLALDLAAKGHPRAPRLSGQVTLERGQLVLPGFKPLRNLGLRLDLTPDALRLSNLVVSSGGGSLLASGEVALKALVPGPFALALRANQLDLGFGPLGNSAFTGNMDINGNYQNGIFYADLRMGESRLKLAELQGQRRLHAMGALPDVVFVDEADPLKAEPDGRAKGRSRRGQRFQVTANIDPLFVRSEELDLQVLADIQARTDETGQVRLQGSAGVRRGSVKVFDSSYEVQRAQVLFSGEVPPDPALDIQLSRRFPDVTLFITLGGSASKPELTLSCQPPLYDNSQILQMILTGKPVLRQGETDSDPSMAVVNALTQAVVGRITRKLVPMVGLDVARVSLEEEKGKTQDEGRHIKAQAEIGKYLTDRLYLGYRKVFGGDEEENSHEAILEYAISARWLLTALFGDRGVGGLDIIWNYRY